MAAATELATVHCSQLIPELKALSFTTECVARGIPCHECIRISLDLDLEIKWMILL